MNVRRQLRTIPGLFWIGVTAVLSFGGFCAWLTSTVADEREQLSLRVGWLQRLQTLETQARGLHMHPDQRAWQRFTDALHAVEVEVAAVRPTVEKELAAADQLGRVDALVSMLRRDNSEISARLGTRWVLLNVVVGVALAMSLVTLISIVLLDRRRRAEEDWRRRLERAVAELDEARARAQMADALKSRFLANVSHEIRTPMNGVLGMAELLLREPLSDEQRVRIGVIKSSGETLLGLVNDIVDLSKIESGHVTVNPMPFALGRLVDELVASLGETATQRGAVVRTEFGADVPKRIIGDSRRWRQILSNLLNSAVEMSRNTTISLRVTTGSGPNGEPQLVVAVEIPGVALTAAEREVLFRPFARHGRRVDEGPGGTGLGLVICRELVQVLGGTIGLSSEEEKGITFEVVLPVVAAPDEAPAVTSPGLVTAAAARPAPPTRGRLLVAEDHDVNRTIISMMLGRLGYPHDLAANGREAVERAGACEYAAILMDCEMPILDGYEAARAIRARETDGARVPIIALTAYAMDGDRGRCLAAGMDDHLPKPLTVDALRLVLDRWLGRTDAT